MVTSEKKTRTVFSVNFMHQKDASKYEGGSFLREETPDIEPTIGMQLNLKEWSMNAYDMDDQPLSLYNYQTWKDHGEGEMNVYYYRYG